MGRVRASVGRGGLSSGRCLHVRAVDRPALPRAAAVTTLSQILTLHDAGHYPDAIADAADVSLGYVHGVLRRERPGRTRKPRPRNSPLRAKILGLRAAGIETKRVAELLANECSRTYVYRVLGEVQL